MKLTWFYQTAVPPTEEHPDSDELFVAAFKDHGLNFLEFDENSMLQKDFTSELSEAKFSTFPVYKESLKNCSSFGLTQEVEIHERR